MQRPKEVLLLDFVSCLKIDFNTNAKVIYLKLWIFFLEAGTCLNLM